MNGEHLPLITSKESTLVYGRNGKRLCPSTDLFFLLESSYNCTSPARSTVRNYHNGQIGVPVAATVGNRITNVPYDRAMNVCVCVHENGRHNCRRMLGRNIFSLQNNDSVSIDRYLLIFLLLLDFSFDDRKDSPENNDLSAKCSV